MHNLQGSGATTNIDNINKSSHTGLCQNLIIGPSQDVLSPLINVDAEMRFRYTKVETQNICSRWSEETNDTTWMLLRIHSTLNPTFFIAQNSITSHASLHLDQ